MGIMVKENFCEKTVKIRMVSTVVKEVVLVFEVDVQRLMCGCALKIGIS